MTYKEFLNNKLLLQKPKPIEGERIIHDSLFDFQKHIVEWALDKGNAGIFADCGLGKTRMQLTWANNIKGRILILSPLAVSFQTVREAKQIDCECEYFKEPNDKMPRVVITNYERAEKFFDYKWDGVVLDESSILKSYDGKTRNMLIGLSSRINHKLSCTATPSPNDFMELGNQAEFLGAMKYHEMLSMFFVHDGGETQKWRLKGHAIESFWQWVKSWAIFVKHPSDIGFSNCGYDLPDFSIRENVCESTSSDMDNLFYLPVCNLLERIKARSRMTPQRCEKAIELAKHDKSCIVWCNLQKEADIISSKLDDCEEIRGSDSPERKENVFMGFVDKKFRVLVTKPSIAGFGMNWQHCSHMIYSSITDSFEEFYQSMRRCWRFGQKENVIADVIYSDVESPIYQNLKQKINKELEMARRMK